MEGPRDGEEAILVAPLVAAAAAVGSPYEHDVPAKGWLDIKVQVGARCYPHILRDLTAVQQGLDALVKMREREGEHLAADLAARIELIRTATGRIGTQAPLVQEQFRSRLLERIKAAGLEGIAADDERKLKEDVHFADRSDITEELTRLRSHFKQFADCLKAKEPVGRTLDFLSQEMSREINTIGSKAQDAVISREVVQVKAELERFREQVQNVE